MKNSLSRLNRAAFAALLSMPLWAVAAPVAINVDGTFGLSGNANIFNSTTVAHTTVTGSLAPGGVNWYSFTGVAGATVFFDHDGADGDTLGDSMLALFRSNGELIAFDDDTSSDAGSRSSTPGNAFLGSVTLDVTDTYYLAISGFGPYPSFAGCRFSAAPLTRPDGGFGGTAHTGCTDRSFNYGGGGVSGTYTLHISNSEGTGSVPTPGSLALVAAGLLAAAAVRRRA